MHEVDAISTGVSEDERTIDATTATRDPLTQVFGDKTLEPIIHRFPYEILAAIFTLLVHETRRSRYGVDLSWIWVTHVCSRWRSIARSLPELWSVIYTTQNQASVEAFLELSQNSPLSVNAYRRLEQLEEVHGPFFDPLHRVADRIQHMKLKLGRYAISGLIALTDYTFASAPLLETLELRYVPIVINPEQYWPIHQSPAPLLQPWFLSDLRTSMLKLRTLSVIDFPLPLASNFVRSTLTDFRIAAFGQFDLWMLQELTAKLPLLEVLHITSIGVDDLQMLLGQPPCPSTELRHLRELVLSLKPSYPDVGGVCTKLLDKFIVPSSCKIQLPLAEADPLHTIDVLMSKKDGRAGLGEPKAFTALRAHARGVDLWPDMTVDCLSLATRKEAPSHELCPAELCGSANDLLNAMRRSPAFPLDAIQVLCIQGNLIEMRLLTHFTGLRELHLHHAPHKEWLKGITLLPPGTLPHLRALMLDGLVWHSETNSEPLSAAVDDFLAARREAGTAIEVLHLLRIRRTDDAMALSWLERMSSELPTFTWTWWPTEQDRASKHRTI